MGSITENERYARAHKGNHSRLFMGDDNIFSVEREKYDKAVLIVGYLCIYRTEQQNQGQKSRAELLAEMRNYKRRRKSYRAKNISITKRTTTEVFIDFFFDFVGGIELWYFKDGC